MGVILVHKNVDGNKEERIYRVIRASDNMRAHVRATIQGYVSDYGLTLECWTKSSGWAEALSEKSVPLDTLEEIVLEEAEIAASLMLD